MALFISDKKSGHREIFSMSQNTKFLGFLITSGRGVMAACWLHMQGVWGSIPGPAEEFFCCLMFQNLTKNWSPGNQLFHFQSYSSVTNFRAMFGTKYHYTLRLFLITFAPVFLAFTSVEDFSKFCIINCDAREAKMCCVNTQISEGEK